MKRKLTLTVNPEITQQAKRLARRRGKSLSGLIEDLLKREAETEFGKQDLPRFSERWGGRMILKTGTDERLAALRRKHGLEPDE